VEKVQRNNVKVRLIGVLGSAAGRRELSLELIEPVTVSQIV
jgi:hypothetical protein